MSGSKVVSAERGLRLVRASLRVRARRSCAAALGQPSLHRRPAPGPRPSPPQSENRAGCKLPRHGPSRSLTPRGPVRGSRVFRDPTTIRRHNLETHMHAALDNDSGRASLKTLQKVETLSDSKCARKGCPLVCLRYDLERWSAGMAGRCRPPASSQHDKQDAQRLLRPNTLTSMNACGPGALASWEAPSPISLALFAEKGDRRGSASLYLRCGGDLFLGANLFGSSPPAAFAQRSRDQIVERSQTPYLPRSIFLFLFYP